jgi:hypothetical protein
MDDWILGTWSILTEREYNKVGHGLPRDIEENPLIWPIFEGV